MDWSKCLICQLDKSESTRSPIEKKNVDPLLIFHSFLEPLKSFRSIGKVPSDLKLLDNIIAEELFQNKAVWHGTCSNRYTESKLTHAIEAAKRTSNESQRSSKRKSLETKTDKLLILR